MTSEKSNIPLKKIQQPQNDFREVKYSPKNKSNNRKMTSEKSNIPPKINPTTAK